jgi:leader peptidase (prepilin peptidase)/N-methyltransferase
MRGVSDVHVVPNGSAPIWSVALYLASGAAAALAVNWAADALPGRDWRAAPSFAKGPWPGATLKRHFIVTLACLLGSLVAGAYAGWGARGFWLVLWGAILLLITVTDIEHRLVLNLVVGPAALLAAAASVFGLGLSVGPLAMLEGGATGLGIFAVIALASRGKMGMGDVKLAGLIGLLLGYPNVVAALFLGIIFGGLVAVLALIRGKGLRSSIPYAPGLALGAIVVLFSLASHMPA